MPPAQCGAKARLLWAGAAQLRAGDAYQYWRGAPVMGQEGDSPAVVSAYCYHMAKSAHFTQYAKYRDSTANSGRRGRHYREGFG